MIIFSVHSYHAFIGIAFIMILGSFMKVRSNHIAWREAYTHIQYIDEAGTHGMLYPF